MKTLYAQLTRQSACQLYKEVLEAGDPEAARKLCKEDLFFLLVVGCKRVDANRDWIYDRCREVEADPDNHLDLWAREHYKSTIITFAKTIQDILNNPDVTVGIFSHTRPIAKSFLVQIKREFEINTFLQNLFPDILYKNPAKEAPKWSLDDGIVVKRTSNPKENTIEAWGIVDGQPTSKHFSHLVYDDVVTQESVTTPEMIKKVTDSWSLSMNLAGKDCKFRYIGTRYHANDTYKTMLDRGTAVPRIYSATDDGTFGGKPVLMEAKDFQKKCADMGSYIASCQLLQNPLADNVMGFKSEWLRHYHSLANSAQWNYYIIVDPASEKKKGSDYTVIVVIGLAQDGNYYLVDAVRDRLNLTERTNKLFELHRKWRTVNVGYEKYGMQSDIEHIKYVQEQQGYRFNITELGGQQPKNDRIRRLVPLFEQSRFYLPYQLLFIGTDGKAHDFVKEFIDYEYSTFPVCSHDDMLDCIARITDADLMTKFPRIDYNQGKPEFAKHVYDVLADRS